MSSSKYFKGTGTRGKPAADADVSSPQNTSMEKLLAEVTKMGTTLKTVATDVSTIKETTTELKNAVSAMQVRMTEAESRISDAEDTIQQLVADRQRLGERIEELWSRIEDLENRSRRNNVRLIGLKEGSEGDDVKACVEKILTEGLKIVVEDGEFEVERAHRSPATRPEEDQPPRVLMIRFLRSTARDKVLKAAKEKRGATWSECRLSFFPDMSKSLADKRKAFKPAKELLHAKNVKFTHAFPSTLKFTWRGSKMAFQNAREAERFIRQRVTGTQFEEGDDDAAED